MEWHTVPSVAREAWARLLEYANPDIAYDNVVKFHGSPSRRDRSNYRKQARQIRATLLQAHEYFDVASNSSLVTSPNHLYYGMVALASAVMLTLGEGSKSLDALRRDASSRSHGLSFSTGLNETGAKTGLQILEKSYVETCSRGFFRNWYTSLPAGTPIFGIVRYAIGGGVGTDLYRTYSQPHRAFGSCIGEKSSVIDLIRYLPDLQKHLDRLHEPVPASRSDYVVEDVGDTRGVSHTWYLHAAPTQQVFHEIVKHFSVPISCAPDGELIVAQTGCSGLVRLWMPRTGLQGRIPCMRYTLERTPFVFATDLVRPEIADAFLVGFALSMLSRYFADLWVTCLESHCKAGRMIDRVVDVLIRKFPVMALEYLSDHELIISRFPPPWHRRGQPR